MCEPHGRLRETEPEASIGFEIAPLAAVNGAASELLAVARDAILAAVGEGAGVAVGGGC
jgi:hypothetical protein